MPNLDDSSFRRTNVSANTPVLSSHQWEQVRDSFNRGAIVSEAASIIAARRAISADPKTATAFTAVSVAAQATAFLGKQAADFANEQAAAAKKVEDAEAAKVAIEQARRVEQARAEAARAARDAASVEQFRREFADAERFHRERVESGRFLREYRDPPSRLQLDRIGRTA